MAGAHPQEIDVAFASNHDLRKRVHAAIDQNPTQSTLFCDISTYILNQTSSSVPEPISKKRKLGEPHAPNGTANGVTSDADILFNAGTKAWRSYPGVSFSMPQRKKLTLELLASKRDGGIRAVGADGKIEFGIAWKDVDQIFCLPVPEKAKRQHNFVVVPVHGDGVNPVPEGMTPPESIVWTFEEATGKNIVEGEDPGPGPMAEAIHHCLLQAGTAKEVIFPTADDFQSAIVQNHRKGEKAYHVKAHRGSKDGYLFLTSVGILWCFKKPLAYFDFSSINSISYTAILRNTFNLNIATPSQEFEFAMIDQADYPGIQDYVAKHNLQDASMAAARRAKKLNVNPPKDDEGKVNGAGEGDVEEESELAKAARLLEEQDDEEDEEDYDPGSEGESEGSGMDSEDDDEDEDGEGGDEGYDEDEGEGEGQAEEYDEGEGEEMEE
ncbi:hypothetical protein BCR34DRAFT_304993 [Clohesyomyces aquaticus]|uniref:Histone chaperone RTT106/FACT complex subunit SPT16-like middle domain-containing protein n=1 Tax=Clohesyomyces aquaticus TaxID=1231657 RepID=A0A1Y1ZQY2_9PLEO|nr:hypothetical protein BCR34DRAFT_304993 [Clohesyomyces aquaticus]